MESDFKDMLRELTAEKVEFLLVGAHAVALHGCPRYTGDIDFWVKASPENSLRVFRALARFGAPLGGVAPDYFSQKGNFFQIGLPPIRIDVITEISGVEFDAAWPNREVVKIDGLDVTIIGRADLLANKKATGRPKDAIDVALLEAGGSK